jgi:hypothetical protein
MSTKNLLKIPPLTNPVPNEVALGFPCSLEKNLPKPDLLTRSTYGAEIGGGLDIPLEQVTPKRSSPQTKHLMRNLGFHAKGQEQEKERKNFKSETTHEVCGC